MTTETLAVALCIAVVALALFWMWWQARWFMRWLNEPPTCFLCAHRIDHEGLPHTPGSNE